MFIKVLLSACITMLIDCHSMDPFIVGGKPASMDQYGHSAFLTVNLTEGAFVCGASILNQHVLLTAAHCFEGYDRRTKIGVRTGNPHKRKGLLRYATKLAVHTAYKPDTIENDIALVYLKDPLVLNENIKRVIIMPRPPRSRTGHVAGWGMIDERKKKGTNMLYQAKQTLWSREECKEMLRRVPLGVLCGGVLRSREYVAEGDSGSALIIKNSIQVGLVSFKKPEISESVVVYTSVPYFYNWITRTARKLHCSS